MSNFLYTLHKELRSARTTRRGATMPANDVPVGVHKEYLRMPKIILPEPRDIPVTLTTAMRARHSASKYNYDRAFTEGELGNLLGHALGIRDSRKLRMYPSGGALFPIETYLVGAVTGDSPGVFHYNPTLHALEALWDLPASFDFRSIIPSKDVAPGSALIVFTAEWTRSSAKYGDLSYLHGLLEAGHMAQNILLLATALKMSARPLAGFDDNTLQELLDLDPDSEQPVYAITISPPTEK